MTEQHHIIHRQQIRITCEEQDNAHYLLDEVSRINKAKLIPLLSKLLDELVPPDQTIRIDSLQLDLGQVRLGSLERDLTEALYKALQAEMTPHLATARAAANTTQARAQRGLEALKTYLHSGQLPWWHTRYQQPDIGKDLDTLLSEAADPTLQLIRQSGQAAIVRRRLAMQFPEATLQHLIRLLEQGNYQQVLAYINEVMRIQQQKPVVRRSQPEVKTALYEFVLTYLIVERGSRFNTRSFVGSTLRQMAARFNLSYLSLLTLLGEAVQQVRPASAEWRSSLPALIQELHEEAILAESSSPAPGITQAGTPQNPDKAKDPEQLSPDRIVALLKHYFLHGSIAWQDQELVRDLPEVLFQQLLLMHPGRALKLIQESIREQEAALARIVQHFSPFSLRKLLEVALPEQAKDWLGWQDSLLKAWSTPPAWGEGLNLPRLLWHILLRAALSENPASETSGENFRHQLWEALLMQSGLDLRDWTDWTAEQGDISIPASLRKQYPEPGTEASFRKDPLRLWQAWNEGLPGHQLSRMGFTSAQVLLDTLVSEKPKELRTWYRQSWSKAEALARRASRDLDEEGIHALIRLQEPEEADTIIRYAAGLQKQHREEPLVNRSSAEYRQLTWELILTALWSDRGSVFNTRSFIKTTIRALAARLGTEYKTLLQHLSHELSVFAQVGGRQQHLLQYIRDLREEEDRRSPVSLPWPVEAGQEEQLLKDPIYRADRLYRLLGSAASGTDRYNELIAEDLAILQEDPVRLQELLGQHYHRQQVHSLLAKPDEKTFRILMRQKGGARESRIRSLQDKYYELMLTMLPAEKAKLLSKEMLRGWTLAFLYQQSASPFRESDYLRFLISKTQEQLRLVPARLAHYLGHWEGEDKETVSKLAKELLPSGESQKTILSPADAFAKASDSKQSPDAWLRYWLPRDTERVGKALAAFLELSGGDAAWWVEQLQAPQRQKLLAMLMARHLPVLEKLGPQLELVLQQMNFSRIRTKDLSALLLQHFLLYLLAPGSRDKNMGHYIQHLLHWLAGEEGAGIGGIRFMARAALSQTGKKVGTQLKALLSYRPQIPEDPQEKVQKPATNKAKEQKDSNLDYYGKDKKDSRELGEPIFVHNAGMVLAWSFLPMLFRRLDYLTPVNKFKDEHYAYRAVHLLEYMATGQEAQPEYNLVLNKILCGIDQAQPITKELQLTEQEKSTADSLIEHGLMANWKVLKGTTVEGLKESFLSREGKLSPATEAWYLTVDKKPFDMLIDYIQWKMDLVKLAWMDKPIYVTWR